MSISTFFNEKWNFQFPSVPNGHTTTVGEFYEGCMRAGMAQSLEIQKAAIVGWHNLLSWYVAEEDARLLIRLWENVNVEENGQEYNQTRRGAITRMKDGFEYAFASNYLARVIYTMAMCGFVPDNDDFKTMVLNRRLFISYPMRVARREEEMSGYPVRNRRSDETMDATPGGFYAPGWYLAHVFGVNNLSYQGNLQRMRDLLPAGVVADWKVIDGVRKRLVDHSFSENEKQLLRAHCLRFLDPINYGLVPSGSHEEHWPKQALLGEEDCIVSLMKAKMRDLLGEDVYQDFCNKALVPPEYRKVASVKDLVSVKFDVVFHTQTRGSGYGSGLGGLSQTLKDDVKATSRTRVVNRKKAEELLNLKRENSFRDWLIAGNRNPHVVASAIARCRRVERDLHVDLAEQYQKDGLATILDSLTYRPGQTALPGDLNIQGDWNTGLASLRAAIQRYKEFEDSLD